VLISIVLNVVFAATLGVFIAFWLLFANNSSLQGSLEAGVRAYPQPPVLNGLLFNPDGLRLLPDELQNRQRPRTGHTLVFVMSDECAPCLRQAPLWAEFINQVPIERTSLVFISFVGERLVSQLASMARNRGIGFESYFISQRQAFSRATGLSSTPKTVVLDGDKRVRLVTTGFDDAVARDIESLLKP
jgi:thiol-disulfide isomerase/thioredoxin